MQSYRNHQDKKDLIKKRKQENLEITFDFGLHHWLQRPRADIEGPTSPEDKTKKSIGKRKIGV